MKLFFACWGVFMLTIAANVQTEVVRTITGTVTDRTNNNPLPGVSVVVKGTSLGANTDIKGNYSIKAPKDSTRPTFRLRLQ